LRPAEPLRVNMIFRKEDGTWLVDQIPQMFPPEAAEKAKSSSFIGPPKP
jgi:hypothetical protein